MKTKLLCLLSALLLTSQIRLNAQTPVNVNLKGEKTVIICGNDVGVVLNDIDRTAKLVDNSGYKIDDRPYAIFIGRNFKKVDKSRVVTIPSSVSIGNAVYTVTTIGQGVFYGYRNIEAIELPNTIATIENYAFYRSSVKQVEFPSSVEYIGNNAFAETKLKKVIIPSTIEHLGDSAFFHTSLESVEITAMIDYIGKDAFTKCSKIKEITLPNSSIVTANVFPDSKNALVRYHEYGSNNVVIRQPKKKKAEKVEEKPKVVYASSSDVDINIPTTKSSNEETFAIVIANENYEKEAKVECAQNDGRSFLKYCQSTLGIPETNLRYVEDATLGNMLEVINWVTNVAKVYEGDARIIVYYAGHGIPDESNGTAFLLPVDVAGKNTAGAYKLSDLYNTLGKLNAKSVTMFLDACFSGSLRGEGMLTSARGVAIKAKPEVPVGNLIVFTAAKEDETAYPYPEKGHGLFTYFLLKKLQETNGDVDYGTLGEYIRKEVSRKSVVVNNKPQTPTVSISARLNDSWRMMKLK